MPLTVRIRSVEADEPPNAITPSVVFLSKLSRDDTHPTRS